MREPENDENATQIAGLREVLRLRLQEGETYRARNETHSRVTRFVAVGPALLSVLPMKMQSLVY